MLRSALRVAFLALFAALAAPATAQDLTWWQGDLPAALEAAKQSSRGAALLYFWRDEDNFCKAMFQDSLSDKACQQEMRNFVCMGIKKDGADSAAAFERFKVKEVPLVLFVQPDGAVVDLVQNFLPPQQFLAELKRIAAGEGTVTSMRAAVAKKPDDLALQMRLARKLRTIGDEAGAEKVVDEILERDPKFASEPAGEAMLMRIVGQVMPPSTPPQDVDLKPLKDFLVKQKNKRILFLGFDRIAAAELARDDIKAAAEAAEKAWRNIPADQVLEWGQKIAAKAYGYHEELSRPQLKLALQISQKALDAAEAVGKERGDPFLANAFYLHASVQIVNNLRKDAFASMERAIALQPNDENLKKALARWKDGSK